MVAYLFFREALSTLNISSKFFLATNNFIPPRRQSGVMRFPNYLVLLVIEKKLDNSLCQCQNTETELSVFMIDLHKRF